MIASEKHFVEGLEDGTFKIVDGFIAYGGYDQVVNYFNNKISDHKGVVSQLEYQLKIFKEKYGTSDKVLDNKAKPEKE